MGQSIFEACGQRKHENSTLTYPLKRNTAFSARHIGTLRGPFYWNPTI